MGPLPRKIDDVVGESQGFVFGGKIRRVDYGVVVAVSVLVGLDIEGVAVPNADKAWV
jgi:hypothetical protein